MPLKKIFITTSKSINIYQTIKHISQNRLGFAAVTHNSQIGLKQRKLISHSCYTYTVCWWGLCSSLASLMYSAFTSWKVVGHCSREGEDVELVTSTLMLLLSSNTHHFTFHWLKQVRWFPNLMEAGAPNPVVFEGGK